MKLDRNENTLCSRPIRKDIERNGSVCKPYKINEEECQYERLENLFTNVSVRAHHRLQKCIVFLRLKNINVSLNPLRHFVKVY